MPPVDSGESEYGGSDVPSAKVMPLDLTYDQIQEMAKEKIIGLTESGESMESVSAWQRREEWRQARSEVEKMAELGGEEFDEAYRAFVLSIDFKGITDPRAKEALYALRRDLPSGEGEKTFESVIDLLILRKSAKKARLLGQGKQVEKGGEESEFPEALHSTFVKVFEGVEMPIVDGQSFVQELYDYIGEVGTQRFVYAISYELLSDEDENPDKKVIDGVKSIFSDYKLDLSRFEDFLSEVALVCSGELEGTLEIKTLEESISFYSSLKAHPKLAEKIDSIYANEKFDSDQARKRVERLLERPEYSDVKSAYDNMTRAEHRYHTAYISYVAVTQEIGRVKELRQSIKEDNDAGEEVNESNVEETVRKIGERRPELKPIIQGMSNREIALVYSCLGGVIVDGDSGLVIKYEDESDEKSLNFDILYTSGGGKSKWEMKAYIRPFDYGSEIPVVRGCDSVSEQERIKMQIEILIAKHLPELYRNKKARNEFFDKVDISNFYEFVHEIMNGTNGGKLNKHAREMLSELFEHVRHKTKQDSIENALVTSGFFEINSDNTLSYIPQSWRGIQNLV